MSERIAYLIGLLILVGIVCLIITLARALRLSYPRQHAEAFYHRTLVLFLVGITLSFAGVLLDMWTNFMSE